MVLQSLAVRRVLIVIGRKDPFIQADDNQRVFLYDINDESGRSTLVPLSEAEYLLYNSTGGRNILEKKQMYYKDGRKNRDEGIMGEFFYSANYRKEQTSKNNHQTTTTGKLSSKGCWRGRLQIASVNAV